MNNGTNGIGKVFKERVAALFVSRKAPASESREAWLNSRVAKIEEPQDDVKVRSDKVCADIKKAAERYLKKQEEKKAQEKLNANYFPNCLAIVSDTSVFKSSKRPSELLGFYKD